MLDLITDPEMRAALGWLGSGIAAVAVAIWTVVKHLRSSGSDAGEGAIDARGNRGIAGREVRIGGDVRIGMSGRAVFAIVAVVAALGAFAIHRGVSGVSEHRGSVNLTPSTLAIPPGYEDFVRQRLERFVSERSDTGAILRTTDPAVLSGAWSSRWKRDNGGWVSGTAVIAASGGDTVAITYRDAATYVINARFAAPGVLVGRYQNQTVASDSTPWIGMIVSSTFIRGYWVHGEWDFSR